jgi:ABC-type Fe3+/spermidine/putrescine transport system ATPase subunit
MSGILEVRGISKSFNGASLLKDLSFDIASGEIVCLLGPSGSGKTTLLRILAGLEEPEQGSVFFAGEDLRGVPPHRRGFGLMFQDLALFPHRNVFDNIAFGLRMQNRPRAEIKTRVREVLKLVGLEGFEPRDVNWLSGGEQQRVALARALAPRPRFLMFDEPLGALDRLLREQLVGDLRVILKQLGQTSLYVTHDQNEGFAIADRVLIIHAGRIVQGGAPRELFEHPASTFVARFLGLNNLLRGRVVQTGASGIRVETEEGGFTARLRKAPPARDVDVLIRPDAARTIVPLESTVSDENVLEGEVVEVRFQIGQPRVTIETRRKTRLTLEWDGPLAAGARVRVALNPDKIDLLEEG